MKPISKSVYSAACLALGLAFTSTFVSAATEASPATPPPDAPGSAHAQSGHRRHGRAPQLGLGREMAAKLGLSEAQVSQLKTAREATRDQIRAVRADTTLSPEDKHARMRQILADSKQQMQKILTPEQQAKLQELRAERQQEASATP